MATRPHFEEPESQGVSATADSRPPQERDDSPALDDHGIATLRAFLFLLDQWERQEQK